MDETIENELNKFLSSATPEDLAELNDEAEHEIHGGMPEGITGMTATEGQPAT